MDFGDFLCLSWNGVCWIVDEGEVEEEKEQNIANKGWFSSTNESDIQQVSLNTWDIMCYSNAILVVHKVMWNVHGDFVLSMLT